MRALLLLIFALLLPAPALAVRAKDVAEFYGVRDNMLTGAGLVVGLRRTGDSVRNEAALRALANRLQGMGLSLNLDELSSRNVAMVMVSSTLGPDQRTGSRLDAVVASTGDATSLEGGVLLMTPLWGPDGEIHAVAEGALLVGGFAVEASGNGTRKNSPTIGRVVGGAIVEKEVPGGLAYSQLTEVDYVLRDPDFTTAMHLAEALDATFGTQVAVPVSSSTLHLTIPEEMHGRFPVFAAMVESTELEVDVPARVVVSERTGTVVMGADVRISAVAVAHGGLTIEVRRLDQISQPSPLSAGTTATVSNSWISAEEQPGDLQLVEGATIGDLVSALNAMGVKPRDLVVILQAIRAAGALQAEIVTI